MRTPAILASLSLLLLTLSQTAAQDSGFRPSGDFKPSGDYKPYGGFGPSGDFKPSGDYKPYGGFGPSGDFRPSGDFKPSGSFRPSGDFFRPFSDFKPADGSKLSSDSSVPPTGIKPQGDPRPQPEALSIRPSVARSSNAFRPRPGEVTITGPGIEVQFKIASAKAPTSVDMAAKPAEAVEPIENIGGERASNAAKPVPRHEARNHQALRQVAETSKASEPQREALGAWERVLRDWRSFAERSRLLVTLPFVATFLIFLLFRPLFAGPRFKNWHRNGV